MLDVVDLSSNRHLRSVSVETTRFIDAALLEWTVPTLNTINSTFLEHIVLGESVVQDRDAARQALASLDQRFIEFANGHALRRIDIIEWTIRLPNGNLDSSDGSIIAFVRDALPRCCARKLVYHESSKGPL